jgi:hypothetical protein
MNDSRWVLPYMKVVAVADRYLSDISRAKSGQ